MTNEEYRALEALNYSGAKSLLQSPAHYKAALAAPHKETAATRIGTRAHMAFLEPSKFNDCFLPAPDLDKRTKEWKEWVAANPIGDGQEYVSQDEYDTIDGIATSAELAIASLRVDTSTWEVEKPIVKVHPASGVTIKGRPDLITKLNGELVTVDLKTCEDANEWAFAKSVSDYKYHMQAAFYKFLTGAKTHILIAVEKKDPFGWRAYVMDEAAIAQGEELMGLACSRYKLCQVTNEWPGYTKELTTLSLPKYAASSTQ